MCWYKNVVTSNVSFTPRQVRPQRGMAGSITRDEPTMQDGGAQHDPHAMAVYMTCMTCLGAGGPRPVPQSYYSKAGWPRQLTCAALLRGKNGAAHSCQR